jgi:hypothetical protein
VRISADLLGEYTDDYDARQYSTGTEYVIVNGKIGIENGKYNGGLHRKLLLLTENK